MANSRAVSATGLSPMVTVRARPSKAISPISIMGDACPAVRRMSERRRASSSGRSKGFTT